MSLGGTQKPGAAPHPPASRLKPGSHRCSLNLAACVQGQLLDCAGEGTTRSIDVDANIQRDLSCTTALAMHSGAWQSTHCRAGHRSCDLSAALQPCMRTQKSHLPRRRVRRRRSS